MPLGLSLSSPMLQPSIGQIVNRKSSIGTSKHLTLCFEPIVKLMTSLPAAFLIELVRSRRNNGL